MLAVTTRNKLHSWRFCLPMLRARRHVKAQLAATPGLLRQVTAVASPTEFFTFTVWESRQAMFNFMSEGAHEAFMWMFARWSASFWSVRWLPTTAEAGNWDGLSLAGLGRPDEQLWQPASAPPLPLSGRRPPGTHVADPARSGVYATTALVKGVTPIRRAALLHGLRKLSRDAGGPQILRLSAGAIDMQRLLVLVLWRGDPEACEGAGKNVTAVQALRQRLGATWTMCWTAGEYEIGHWDHLRLRQLAAARTRIERMEPMAWQ